MQHHLKNFYTKLAFKKFGKMSQLILQFRKSKNHFFNDGNKRTAMMATNQIMIQNGKGIISVSIEHQITFRGMLINFYETNDMIKIKKFLYDKCIDGIKFEK